MLVIDIFFVSKVFWDVLVVFVVGEVLRLEGWGKLLVGFKEVKGYNLLKVGGRVCIFMGMVGFL